MTPPGLDRGKPTDKKGGAGALFRFLLTVTGILGIGTITPLLFIYTYMRHPNLHYMKLETFKECLTHHDLASDKALFN